jgi:hypothetical protein
MKGLSFHKAYLGAKISQLSKSGLACRHLGCHSHQMALAEKESDKPNYQPFEVSVALMASHP